MADYNFHRLRDHAVLQMIQNRAFCTFFMLPNLLHPNSVCVLSEVSLKIFFRNCKETVQLTNQLRLEISWPFI